MPLQTGDRVVELAALCRTSGLFSGLVASGVTIYFGLQSWRFTTGGALVGAILGYVIGWIIGRFLFTAVDGQVLVVKHGMGSLPFTLKATLFSSVCVTILVALFAYFTLPQTHGFGIWISCLAAIGVGVCFALMASLA